MSTLTELASEFLKILRLPEGPEVETSMQDFGSNAPSAEAIKEVKDWNDVLDAFHAANIDDQFMPPVVLVDDKDKDKKPVPVGTVKDGDVLVYWDFRTDRAKPLTASFLDIPFEGQVGGLSDEAITLRPKLDSMVTMTHYDDRFLSSPLLHEAYNPAKPLEDTYAEVAGRLGIRQLVCAETEKWRAVTWFKDGRRNLGYKFESTTDAGLRIEQHPNLPITVKVAPSRKVSAHVEAPQMRALEIQEALYQGVQDGIEDIFANFANADMVGHATTDVTRFERTVDAIVELDVQLGKLVPAAVAAGYVVMITGDHGNAEQMIHPNGKANPAHTVNKVPYIVLGLDEDERKTLKLRPDTTIGDMAPTTMFLRGLDIPASWDCSSALVGDGVKAAKGRKVMKLVLDGYGIRDEEEGNAMAHAAKRIGHPLHMDRWMLGEDGALFTPAEASGVRCGYPEGVAGTTEFGHVLFDAGRTVLTDLNLINDAVESGKFSENDGFLHAIKAAKEQGAAIHCMGVLSDGMVHSSLVHIEALIKVFAAAGVPSDQILIHGILDGRDVPGDSSPKYVTWLQDKLREIGAGRLCSLWGRGWGKDRDNRWRRIETAFRSLVAGTAAVHITIKK